MYFLIMPLKSRFNAGEMSEMILGCPGSLGIVFARSDAARQVVERHSSPGFQRPGSFLVEFDLDFCAIHLSAPICVCSRVT